MKNHNLAILLFLGAFVGILLFFLSDMIFWLILIELVILLLILKYVIYKLTKK